MKLKMSTEIMAGEGPDIFSLSQKLPFEKLTDSKTIADVNELISEFSYDIGIDNCDSKIMDAGVIDGKDILYLCSIHLMFYNYRGNT